MSVPMIALVPPRRKLAMIGKKRSDLCGSCERPIDKVTGECAGCSD